ncbi:MAG: hypothetical protein ABI266_02280 [Ginsengibacter sp.]
MFSFIKQYTEKIEGANMYAMFSLLVFVIFFIVLLIAVKKMSKKKIDILSALPFDDSEIINSNSK